MKKRKRTKNKKRPIFSLALDQLSINALQKKKEHILSLTLEQLSMHRLNNIKKKRGLS